MSTKSSIRQLEPFEERCYVVYGNGFTALKIKGIQNKKKLIENLKKKGFHPSAVLFNPHGQICTNRATKY